MPRTTTRQASSGSPGDTPPDTPRPDVPDQVMMPLLDRIVRQSLDEEAFDRSAAIDHLPQNPHQRGEVRAIGPAVNQVFETIAIPRRFEAADECGRRASHHRQHAFDRIEHALDTAERERRRDERDHFPVGGALIAVNHPHRIGYRMTGVEFRVECVQPGP